MSQGKSQSFPRDGDEAIREGFLEEELLVLRAESWEQEEAGVPACSLVTFFHVFLCFLIHIVT